jgi:hypothetical protein
MEKRPIGVTLFFGLMYAVFFGVAMLAVWLLSPMLPTWANSSEFGVAVAVVGAVWYARFVLGKIDEEFERVWARLAALEQRLPR